MPKSDPSHPYFADSAYAWEMLNPSIGRKPTRAIAGVRQ
jgi:hypothetical protein